MIQTRQASHNEERVALNNLVNFITDKVANRIKTVNDKLRQLEQESMQIIANIQNK